MLYLCVYNGRMRTIIQKENPALRKKARAVLLKDITGAKIKQLIRDMKEALSKEEDGVAIAAPQLGVSVRIFVIVDRLPEPKKKETETTEKTDKRAKDLWKNIPLVYINPTLLKLSREKAWMDEGCLSVRPFYGKVSRSKKATIRAYDENGIAFERGASGLLAQIFQHEIDHLDGTLFTDKAKDVVEIKPQEENT